MYVLLSKPTISAIQSEFCNKEPHRPLSPVSIEQEIVHLYNNPMTMLSYLQL